MICTSLHNSESRKIQSSRLEDYFSERGIEHSSLTRALDCKDDDVVFATGSLLDGVGDSQSDLDLYVLTSKEGFDRRRSVFDPERRTQQERLGFGIIYCEVHGQALDAECHLIIKYDALLDALERLDPLSRSCLWENFRSLGPFERGEAVELLHRFRIGVSIHGLAEFDRLRARFDERKFLAWNSHFHLIEAEDFIKGVKRSLHADDPENAHLKLLRLLDSLADAKLYLSGISLDRWKWRLPKLRMLADQSFLNLFLTVQMGEVAGETLGQRVRTALERAEDLHRSLFEELRNWR